MADLVASLRQKFFDANGAPLAGGKLYSYQAGTSTPLVTWSNQDESTENTNPIILDANGEADVWVGPNAYKFVLADADDVVLWTVDNVSHLSPDSISTLMLQDGSVTTLKIADDAVTTDKISDDAIMPDDSVPTAAIQDGAVIVTKLGDEAVETAKIKDLNVTTGKLADSAVVAAKIADGAITPAKLAWASSYAVSSSMPSNFFSTTSTSYVSVTNLSVTITTNGRPVLVALNPSGGTVRAYFYATNSNGTSGNPGAAVKIVRDGSDIGHFSIDSTTAAFAAQQIPASSIQLIDTTASAGIHTYTVTLACLQLTSTATLQGCVLVAIQL